MSEEDTGQPDGTPADLTEQEEQRVKDHADYLESKATEVPTIEGRRYTNKRYLNEQIAREHLAWDKIGLNTRMFDIDGFIIETQLRGLVGYLSEKGIIDVEELHLFYGSMLLEKMQYHRKKALEQLEEERAEAARRAITDGVTGFNAGEHRDPRRHIT